MCYIDRYWITLDPGQVIINQDGAILIVNLSPFNKDLAGMQEVLHIPCRLEANDIIGTKSLVDRLAYPAGEELPVVGSGPGDVGEVLKDGIWYLRSDVTCGQI